MLQHSGAELKCVSVPRTVTEPRLLTRRSKVPKQQECRNVARRQWKTVYGKECNDVQEGEAVQDNGEGGMPVFWDFQQTVSQLPKQECNVPKLQCIRVPNVDCQMLSRRSCSDAPCSIKELPSEARTCLLSYPKDPHQGSLTVSAQDTRGMFVNHFLNRFAMMWMSLAKCSMIFHRRSVRCKEVCSNNQTKMQWCCWAGSKADLWDGMQDWIHPGVFQT